MYTKDITIFVLSATGSEGQRLAIAEATVSFGDGATATVTWPCDAEASSATTTHTFRRPGQFAIAVLSSRLCDGTQGSPEGTAGLLVEPSAPEAAASWPTCSAFQLKMSGLDRGSSLGNGGAIVTLHNVASTPCRLDGYPRLALVGPAGALPTRLEHATAGAYLFPAIPARLVALRPEAYASFQIAYAATPFGPRADQPPDFGCLPATRVRVYLPGMKGQGAARFDVAPCDGWLSVSPVFPGRDWITFQ